MVHLYPLKREGGAWERPDGARARSSWAKTNMTNSTAATSAIMIPKPNACIKPKLVSMRSSLPWLLNERGRIGRRYHDLSISNVHYLHPTTDSYRLFVVLLVGVFGCDRDDCLPPLAVHEHPTRQAGSDRLTDDSCFPDHPFYPGLCRPSFGRACFAQTSYKNYTHDDHDRHEGYQRRRKKIRVRRVEEHQNSQDKQRYSPDGG